MSIDYCTIQVPVNYAGEVMGKLTSMDIPADNIDSNQEYWNIQVDRNKLNIKEFEVWLAKVTGGQATIK